MTHSTFIFFFPVLVPAQSPNCLSSLTAQAKRERNTFSLQEHQFGHWWSSRTRCQQIRDPKWCLLYMIHLLCLVSHCWENCFIWVGGRRDERAAVIMWTFAIWDLPQQESGAGCHWGDDLMSHYVVFLNMSVYLSLKARLKGSSGALGTQSHLQNDEGPSQMPPLRRLFQSLGS